MVFLLSFVFDSPVVVVSATSGSSTCDGAMPMISMISTKSLFFCGERKPFFGREFPPAKKKRYLLLFSLDDVSSMVARGDEEDAEKAATTTKQRHPIPPLHVAARTGDLDALSALLASNHRHHHHRNDAAQNNPVIKFIDERDVHGRTALHLAAWANEKAVVERLLDSGADVSVGAADGVQAIHFACMKGHLGKMLLFFIPILLLTLEF